MVAKLNLFRKQLTGHATSFTERWNIFNKNSTVLSLFAGPCVNICMFVTGKSKDDCKKLCHPGNNNNNNSIRIGQAFVWNALQISTKEWLTNRMLISLLTLFCYYYHFIFSYWRANILLVRMVCLYILISLPTLFSPTWVLSFEVRTIYMYKALKNTMLHTFRKVCNHIQLHFI